MLLDTGCEQAGAEGFNTRADGGVQKLMVLHRSSKDPVKNKTRHCPSSSTNMGLGDDDPTFTSNIPVAVDVAVAVVYFVFGVCSLFGNGTLLYVSYKKKHLLKPAEFLIINLAISDMGLTLSLYPMAITSSLFHRWLYGKTMCHVYAFCGMLFGICSLTTLTLLSMVCFVKVCYPLYGNRFNSFHGRLLMACAWTYALLFAACPLAHWGEYGPEPYGTACCIDWSLSNQHTKARSYTVVVFLFCYILPCCIIVASYTGILITVRASHKTMEKHASRPTHMSSIQAIIVKLSIAVCIGFFAAWSPYAVVSMWAAFGHIEDIPPLAFAIPAMFAKSSTIYNPIIYLTLRPNFRHVMCQDLGSLRHSCLGGCLCLCPQNPEKSPAPKPTARVSLRAMRRLGDQSSTLNGCSGPHMVESNVERGCDKCGDAFECFRHYPRTCHAEPRMAAAVSAISMDQGAPPPESPTRREEMQSLCQKKSLRAITCGKRTSEIENLHISLEMVPGHTKVAWP